MVCVSAGILFYRNCCNKEGEREYLMLRVWKKRELYEDAGGKREPEDESLWETAAREAAEELNYPFGKDSKEYIMQLRHRAYVNLSSKYVLFLVPYPLRYVPDFGTVEIHTGIPRTVGFVPGSVLTRENINPRLRFMLKHFAQKSHMHTSLKKRAYDQ